MTKTGRNRSLFFKYFMIWLLQDTNIIFSIQKTLINTHKMKKSFQKRPGQCFFRSVPANAACLQIHIVGSIFKWISNCEVQTKITFLRLWIVHFWNALEQDPLIFLFISNCKIVTFPNCEMQLRITFLRLLIMHSTFQCTWLLSKVQFCLLSILFNCFWSMAEQKGCWYIQRIVRLNTLPLSKMAETSLVRFWLIIFIRLDWDKFVY